MLKPFDNLRKSDISSDGASPGPERLKKLALAIFGLVLTLGSYSEAVSLISAGYVYVQKQLTNSVEYKTLASIHVGNDEGYISEVLPTPQVSRMIGDGIQVKYYYSQKHLQMVYFKNERVVAHSVLSLQNSFRPPLQSIIFDDLNLGDFSFEGFGGSPQAHVVDASKTNRYYIESFEGSSNRLFLQSYMGYVHYGALFGADYTVVVAGLRDLYQVEVYGEEVEGDTTKVYRSATIPNFVGSGELSLELIEKSLLTGAEIESFFGQE